MRIPKVAALHDLTGVGRCALSSVMPILSAMGCQVCPLPTAVLSTHPGGYTGFAFEDMAHQTRPILEHWQREGVTFDAVYTGFFSGADQVRTARHCLQPWIGGERALLVVDPVMADNGKPYRFCTDELRGEIRALSGTADLITPNWTEAHLLLDRTYSDGPVGDEELDGMLCGLLSLGCRAAVITGVPRADNSARNALAMAEEGGFWFWDYATVPAQYPGTGDLFASMLVGALMRRRTLPEALVIAGEFASLAVRSTWEGGTPPREGVGFEPLLPGLWGDASSERQASRYLPAAINGL